MQQHQSTPRISSKGIHSTQELLSCCFSGAGGAHGSKSTLVDSRLIYPIPSATASIGFEKKDPGWKLLTDNLLGPFGYTFPDPDPGYIRKYRLRAIYYDENAGGTYHLKVKIDLPAGR